MVAAAARTLVAKAAREGGDRRHLRASRSSIVCKGGVPTILTRELAGEMACRGLFLEARAGTVVNGAAKSSSLTSASR